MEHYHLIKVRHHYKQDGSSQVRLRSDRFKQTLFIPYTCAPDETEDPVEEAIKWLYRNGHNVVGKGKLNEDYILCIAPIKNSFKQLKPKDGKSKN